MKNRYIKTVMLSHLIIKWYIYWINGCIEVFFFTVSSIIDSIDSIIHIMINQANY